MLWGYFAAEEHWGTAEEPYEDSLAPEKLMIPYEVNTKRMGYFGGCAIVDPAVPATPPPPTPEPKAAAGKKGAPAPAAKKGEPEPQKKLPPPKHAHVRSKFQLRPLVNIYASLGLTDALQAWSREEERIQRELQNRERVYMGFEDAIAYIVNERPRDLLADVDFDADDLVDNGEDEDEAIGTDMDVSNATSPWGVMPPPRIEIAPNAVYKPEIPHGEIFHADMASYFRIVEQLYCTDNESTNNSPAPFLWQAIYPQDSSGHPIYNPGGKYSVKLFVFGRWRRVDIDDKLPLDADGNVIYLASSMKNEIWPSLIVKALYKVLHWLHPNSMLSGESNDMSIGLVNSMCQSFVQIMLTLTSWKVSRWEPGTTQSFSDNIFHQLLQFVPSTQPVEQLEEPSDVSLETESIAGGTAENSLIVDEVADKSVVSLPKVADMLFGEVVLVTDVVGDTGNTTFKVVRQGTPLAISEEVTGVNELFFLLVHPVLQYSDTFVRAWSPNPDPPLEGAADLRVALIPFEAPRVQFVVVTVAESVPEQPPGDSSSDTPRNPPAHVNLVATLTPVQPPEQPNQTMDNLARSSKTMAMHLNVDPSGSVILIEEMEEKKTSRSSLPAVVTLNSIFSGYISIPPADKNKIVYSVYPQTTLRYGYCIQVDSDHKTAFQDAPTYWRSLENYHVLECDGVYPVMLPGTWNILFKHTFELTAPVEENEGKVLPSLELRVDLHVSEALLARCTHISIINDGTGEIKRVSSLCSKVTLPAASNEGIHLPITYTLVVDCAPGSIHVREGKWKLTLASDWSFAKATTHQMKMTRFEGLELLKDEDTFRDLAVKLEVFDLGADQNPKIGEISSKGEVRLLQLPAFPPSDNGPPPDDKRGYIIQGSIDRSSCIVPSELQSLRPFRSNSSQPAKENAAPTLDENTPADGSLDGDASLQLLGAARSFRAPSGIKWRLTCWSTDEVKLQEDNTKELQYEAIRASWAEKAVDRNTNGAVSRLLYLGKLDEAEARMKQDSMTDEQIAKVRSRFEWVQAVKAKVDSKANAAEGVGGSYLEEVAAGDEKLLSDEKLADSKRLLLERIGVVEADKEQRRVARALAKEERAKELRNMVRSVIEKRAASLKRQQELKREQSTVQTQSA
ncbi:unnamed protein product [Phytophthora lilii]|uniref:Unnamed protein product n=1 Tax=Phytophthora lilii TaxID=2077276 RepID=A0A9W6TG49_9STRA|nr:unnamed protein product [Phytophthora lilii]